ncbi:MAG: glutathione S-transferase family protein [Planctomycetota bacterium]
MTPDIDMSTLELFDLAPSPNNVKVRLALGFKNIPYERVPVAPNDRAKVVEVTGQPLTPAIRHGAVRLFDSAAILRYLEANFPDTPRLFSTDYAEMQQIERWELRGRTEIAPCIGRVFGQFFAPSVDAKECEAASAALHAATRSIEERLADSKYLVRDSVSAADVSIAPFVWYGMLAGGSFEPKSIQAFFAEHLHLGEGRERTRTWARSLMAFDR